MKLVRCKACGFIMEESKLHEVCPACGVKRQMFEPYEENISPQRKMILDRHLHPVIVHAPQALGFILLFLALALLVIPQQVKADFLGAIRIMSIILPLSVLGSFLTGLLDGKVRFRKVTTPILVQKIILGIVFFIASSAMAVTAILGLENQIYLIVYLFCNSLVFISSINLGVLGASLINARFPGK